MDPKELNIIEHLEEVRKRLLYIIGSFLTLLALSLFFVEQIYSLLVKGLDVKLALLGPSDVLWIYFKIGAVCAIAFTLPIAGYHIWKFVLPALKPHERRGALLFIPSLFLLFIGGISFGYFVVFPIVLSFMQDLAGAHFIQFYTSQNYFSFLIRLTLPFGILFELPAIVLFLTSFGLLKPHILKKSRKIAYFIIAVTSILLTPPDFISDILVLIPLLFIYEISINLSAFVYRKKLQKEADLQEMGLSS